MKKIQFYCENNNFRRSLCRERSFSLYKTNKVQLFRTCIDSEIGGFENIYIKFKTSQIGRKVGFASGTSIQLVIFRVIVFICVKTCCVSYVQMIPQKGMYSCVLWWTDS